MNEELIRMYWKIGECLSKLSKETSYGDSFIEEVSKQIQLSFPGIKGFDRRGLYRMRQFYETYKDNENVSPLVTQLSWTNNLIMSDTKTIEEKDFYIRLCIKENYTKRQLKRQIDSAYYERYMLSKELLLQESKDQMKENPFQDSYIIEFLDLPSSFKESDLREGIIRNMKHFVLELGNDFSFVGEEYRIQVGGEDYRIDLLFFHRSLKCLVALILKLENSNRNTFLKWISI